MYKNKKIIGIITARSGSKSLPNKNIKLLNGKPLIAYTIETAIKSKVFDYLMVSTDSPKYAKIAEEFGANVPFLRSEVNANDTATSWAVCEEVLNKLDEKFDIVMLLQPTSPFRTVQNIQGSLELFMEKNADVVVSVTKTTHPVEWCNTLPEDHSLHNFVKEEYANTRRQDLPQSYITNGVIYIIKSHLIEPDLNLFCKNSYAYVMDEDISIDIDTERDFMLAQALLNMNNQLNQIK